MPNFFLADIGKILLFVFFAKLKTIFFGPPIFIIPLKLTKGEVPKELFGTFYRNGPGQLERNGDWVHHPFDGDGMITAMRFENGEVKITNKFVRTEGWESEQKAKKFLFRGVFGTQKPGGIIANAFDLRLKNIANTNVLH